MSQLRCALEAVTDFGVDIAALGSPRTAKIKHQSQTGEVLSDVGQNESKIKEKNFPAGLDKVVGFIEAQGLPWVSQKKTCLALKGRQWRKCHSCDRKTILSVPYGPFSISNPSGPEGGTSNLGMCRVEEFTGSWEGWMPPGRAWMNYSLACDEEFDSTFDSWGVSSTGPFRASRDKTRNPG